MSSIKNSYLDDPKITISRKNVFQHKGFISKIYEDWYFLINENLPRNHEIVLELGSGAGFIQNIIQNTITSDVLFLPFIDCIMDGLLLPFSKNSINCLVMIDVFHHISNVDLFFDEAIRILSKSGRIIMIEPWINRWSTWIYSNFHHEAIDISTERWDFASSGPLSGANQALPWIVFKRDRKIFEEKYPALKIKEIQPIMPILYLLSGGLENKISMPAFLYSFCKKVEHILFNEEEYGMFSLIVLEKN